jgi:ceramide glucosyltransferase
MLRLARHDVLVIADSDIEVRADYLASLMSELSRPGVGAETCLYRGVAMPGRWSRHSALGINAHFLPNAVTALSLGLAQPCFGPTTHCVEGSCRALVGYGRLPITSPMTMPSARLFELPVTK